MFAWVLEPEIWASLITLSVLEIVLGIDNLVFLSVAASRLPKAQQPAARRFGLLFALATRIALLFSISWVIQLTEPLFTVFDVTFSWRDIILFAGGLFLLIKGTQEIHAAVEGLGEPSKSKAASSGFLMVVIQIGILDIVFSIDSVITAVGMTDNLPVMVTAIVIAIIVMIFAAEPVGRFIDKHPTTKMLALSFLLLVGMALIADGFHFHIPRGYLYFAIAFSMGVETLNIFTKIRRARRIRGSVPRK